MFRHKGKLRSLRWGIIAAVLLLAAAGIGGMSRPVQAASRQSALTSAFKIRQETITKSTLLSKATLSKPTGLTIKCLGLARMKLTWNKVAGASGYRVYEKLWDAAKYVYVGTVNGNSVYINNLFKAGKRYSYKVQAVKGKTTSAMSAVKSVTAEEGSRKITSRISGKTVKLTLKAVPTAASYVIRRRTGTSGSFKTVASNVTSTTWTDKSASWSSTYQYRYYAVYKYNSQKMNGSGSSAITVKTSAPVTTPKYRALLIGNSYYMYQNSLPGPTQDVAAMKAMLEGRNYDKVSVSTNLYTKSAMLSAISTAFAGAGSKDVSLFYYSGHGVLDVDNSKYEGALSPTGSHTYSECLSLGELAAALKKVPGKVIILLDSCSSGSGLYEDVNEEEDVYPAYDDSWPDTSLFSSSKSFNEAVVSAFEKEDEPLALSDSGDLLTAAVGLGDFLNSKFYVITAASYRQSSKDSNGGLFTKALVNGCGYGFYSHAPLSSSYMPADSNKNNILSLAEAYSYIRSNTSYIQDALCYPNGSTLKVVSK